MLSSTQHNVTKQAPSLTEHPRRGPYQLPSAMHALLWPEGDFALVLVLQVQIFLGPMQRVPKGARCLKDSDVDAVMSELASVLLRKGVTPSKQPNTVTQVQLHRLAPCTPECVIWGWC